MAAEATCALCATSEVVYTAFALHEWSERHAECEARYPHALKVQGSEDDAHARTESAHPDGVEVRVRLDHRDAHLAQFFADQAGVSLEDWVELAVKKATVGA